MFSKLNLQQKLLLSLTSILSVLVIILSSAFYNYLSSVALNNELSTSQRITERISFQIDELYKQMDLSALFIVKNEEVHSVLLGLNSRNAISEYEMINYQAKASEQLKVLSFNFPNIISAMIFDQKKSFYFRSGLPADDEMVNKRLCDITWYKSLISDEKQTSVLPPHQDFWVNFSRPVISVVRKLFLPDQNFVLFELDLPYWNLQNICDTNTISTESRTLIFDSGGGLLYPLENSDSSEGLLNLVNPDSLYSEIKDRTDSSGQLKVNGSNVLYSSHKSKYTDFNIVLVSKQTIFQKLLTTYRFFIVFACMILLVVIFLTFYLLIKGLTKPLKQLTSTIKKVSLDNLSLEIPVEGYDEIKILNNSFNAMFSNLKDSINQIYESKIRETNTALLALQAQINPHFLYNTLSVISASSEKYGNLETASICNKLSEIMRYIVSPGDSMVTLQEELTHTKNYLSLMRSHYQDYHDASKSFLNYEIDIPIALDSIRLPKMTLQPIVENCINHGFRNTFPPWHIKIYGKFSAEDEWCVIVEDDGSGIEANTLQKINTQIDEYYNNLRKGNFKQNLKIGGMGILNTFARLAIIYKDSTIFTMENHPIKGCIVTLGRKNISGGDA